MSSISEERDEMRERPLSVTIVAWFVILSGIISVAAIYASGTPGGRVIGAPSALPHDAQLAIAGASALVSILCGIFILRGREWARLLYVAWNAAGLAMGALTAPLASVLLLSLLLLGVITYFLFRGPANIFFGRSWLGDDETALP
jgi:hypothetical protein